MLVIGVVRGKVECLIHNLYIRIFEFQILCRLGGGGENLTKQELEKVLISIVEKHEKSSLMVENWILAERWKGSITTGVTVTKLKGGKFNIDFDNRCECCGLLFERGSIVLDHLSIHEAAEKIHKIIFSSTEVNCSQYSHI